MELNWRAQSCALMTITPAMAQLWLQLHNKFNRVLKPSVIEQYRRDLLADRKWPVTHQGIAFDWNGQLIDGQHRLTALVKAAAERPAVAVTMYVTTGLDPLTRAVVDTHSKRNAVDVFTLSGRKTEYGTISANSAIGMWTRMMIGISMIKGRETRQELISFAERHKEGGEFALEQFGKWPRFRYVQVAPVMAAVARAYYHVADRVRMEQFVEVLSTGIMRSPDDEAAVRLRNLLSQGNLRGNSNLAGEIYGKTCRAIQYFMRRESVSKFYQPSEEPFPLPDRTDPATTTHVDRVVGNSGELFKRGRGVAGLAEASH